MIRHFARRGDNSLEGASAPRSVVRTVTFDISPGATPGTNIDVTVAVTAGRHYNLPILTDATNLAKSGTSGSYSLSSSGAVLTVDLTEVVLGILSSSITVHDINSSSTTEMWTGVAIAQSDKIDLGLVPRGSTSRIDLTGVMDAGDRVDILVCFITAS